MGIQAREHYTEVVHLADWYLGMGCTCMHRPSRCICQSVHSQLVTVIAANSIKHTSQRKTWGVCNGCQQQESSSQLFFYLQNLTWCPQSLELAKRYKNEKKKKFDNWVTAPIILKPGSKSMKINEKYFAFCIILIPVFLITLPHTAALFLSLHYHLLYNMH